MRSVPTGNDRFEAALARIAAAPVRPEFVLSEAPAPQRLAPSAVAVTAEMADPELDLVSGRLVLLHDPDGVDEWDGSFRVVVFVRAHLESDLVEDPLLHDVAWSWVDESLDLQHCQVSQLGGTVTRTSGRSFGSMSDRPSDGFVEIRASWTPVEDAAGSPVDDLASHTGAWLDLLAQAGGLPPLPTGVTHVDTRRARHRG